MSYVKQLVVVPYLPVTILATLAWFGGSGYWYICKTQELCTTKASSQTPEPDPVALAADKAAASQTQTETTQTTKGTAKPVKTEPKKTVLGAARVKTTDGFDTSQVVTILFNADSSSFREVTWEKQVRAIAKYLDKHPKQKVEVVGYAAKVKSGSDEDQLSIHRAAAVKNYLVDWGASAKQIVIRGEGYDDPIDDNITDAGRARNRRAVLRFINE